MMKKAVSFVLLLCMTISLCMGIAVGAEKVEYNKIGDIDGDDEITVADALVLLRIASKLDSQDLYDIELTDVTGDKNVMVDDALAVLRCSAGLANGFGYANVPVNVVPNSMALSSGLTQKHIDEAVVNIGNTSGIVKAMQKAQRGEPITVTVLGGSITMGSAASSPNTCYAGLMASWWKENFPQSDVTFYNKGIGATTSSLGVHRLEQDILNNNPDFIIVEFAVNDAETADDTEAYENIIRRLMKYNSNMGIMSLFMVNETGWSCQAMESPMLMEYQIPQISYRNVILDMMNKEKSIVWKDISPDDIHPNDRGHAIAGSLVTSFLDAVKEKMDLLSLVPAAMPEPVYGERFMDATLYMGGSLEPMSYGDWSVGDYLLVYLSGSWETESKGKPLTFTIKAHDVSIGYVKTTTKNRSGILKVVVDGNETASVDSFFENGWGSYLAVESVFSDDDTEEHIFQFTCVSGMFSLACLLIS